MDKDCKIVTVVQARMGSTRLPFKVLMSLAGKPLLQRMVERVLAAELAGTVVVATTTDPSDDPIVEMCEKEGFNVFRGDPLNLLDRHYQAARAYNADAVIKIPSDCPLIDPQVIDRVIRYYLNNYHYFDFVSNLHPPTYPDGNDVEIMSMQTIEKAWKQAERKLELEHTTPYIWENPHLFRIGNVYWETGLDYSMTHRWTIDYEEDYLFIKSVYDELYDDNPMFSIFDILQLLERKPKLVNINAKYNGVNWYRNHIGELRTIDRSKTKFV